MQHGGSHGHPPIWPPPCRPPGVALAPAATPGHRRQRRMRDAAPASAWMASSACSGRQAALFPGDAPDVLVDALEGLRPDAQRHPGRDGPSR